MTNSCLGTFCQNNNHNYPEYDAHIVFLFTFNQDSYELLSPSDPVMPNVKPRLLLRIP